MKNAAMIRSPLENMDVISTNRLGAETERLSFSCISEIVYRGASLLVALGVILPCVIPHGS